MSNLLNQYLVINKIDTNKIKILGKSLFTLNHKLIIFIQLRTLKELILTERNTLVY